MVSGKTAVSWKGIAFWVIVICIVAFAVIYFLPLPNNPVRNLVSLIASKLHFNFDTSNITKSVGTLVSNNWATIAGVGITAVPLGYAYIKSYMSQKKTEKELQAAQELSKLTESKDTAEIQNLKDKLATYESDTTASELQKKILGFTTEKEQLQNKIQSLNGQIEILQKTPTQICESLWAKSGGQVIQEGGNLYRIIEKETVKVI